MQERYDQANSQHPAKKRRAFEVLVPRIRCVDPLGLTNRTAQVNAGSAPRVLGRSNGAQESRAMLLVWTPGFVLGALFLLSCGPGGSEAPRSSHSEVFGSGGPVIEVSAGGSVSLEDAMRAAEAGSTIRLKSGTYPLSSSIVITKPLHLVGESGMFDTVIDAQGRPSAFVIRPSASGTSIRGLTIKNASAAGVSARGTLATPVRNVKVQNCRFLRNRIGMSLKGAHAIIERNLWVDSQYRAMHLDSFDGEIRRNTIVGSAGIAGKILVGAHIRRNLFSKSGGTPGMGFGMVITAPSASEQVQENLVFGDFGSPFGAAVKALVGGRWFSNVSRRTPLALEGPKYARVTAETLGYGHVEPTVVDSIEGTSGLRAVLRRAEDGDSFVLKEGTHLLSSDIVLTKAVHVIGASGMFGTVVDAAGGSHAFSVRPSASGASIQGLTIKNAGASGISVVGTQAHPVRGLTVQDCRFLGNKMGMSLRWSDAAIRHNLWVKNTYRAVHLSSFDGEMRNNTVIGSSGIAGTLGAGARVHHNLLEMDEESAGAVFGFGLVAPSPATQVYENLVYGPFSSPFGGRVGLSSGAQWFTNVSRSLSLGLRGPKYARITEESSGTGYAKPTVVDSVEGPFGLRAALARAEEGDVIALKAGVYPITSGLTITRPVHLIGESGMFETTIDAQGRPSALMIRSTASGTSIQGLTIRNARAAGISVRGTNAMPVQDLKIQDCRFIGNRIGASLVASTARVSHSLWVDNAYRAIQLTSFSGQIDHNTVVRSPLAVGSTLENARLHHNVIFGESGGASLNLGIAVKSATPELQVYDNLSFGDISGPFYQNGAIPVRGELVANQVEALVPVTLREPKYTDLKPLYPDHGYHEKGGVVPACARGVAMNVVLSPGTQVEPCAGFLIEVPQNAVSSNTPVSLTFEANPASASLSGKAVFSEGLVTLLRMEPSMPFGEPLQLTVPVTLLGSQSVGLEYLAMVVDDTHEPSIELKEMKRSVIQFSVPHFSSMTVHDWSWLDEDAKSELLDWASGFYTFRRSAPSEDWPPVVWPPGRPLKKPTMVRSQGRGDGCNTGHWDLEMGNGSATGAHARYGRPNNIVIDGVRVSHCVHAEFDDSFSGNVMVRARQRNNVCDGSLHCILYNEEQCGKQIGFWVFHAPFHSYNNYSYHLFKKAGDEQRLSRDYETFNYEVPESSRFVLVCRGDYGSHHMPMEIDSILTSPGVPCIKPYPGAACNKDRPGYDCPAMEPEVDDPNFCNSSSFDSDNFEHFGTCYRSIQSDADAGLPLVRGQQCCYTDGWDNGSGSVDKTGTARAKKGDNSCKWTKNLGRIRKHCLEDVEFVCRSATDDVEDHCACMGGCRFFDSRCHGLGFIPGLRF